MVDPEALTHIGSPEAGPDSPEAGRRRAPPFFDRGSIEVLWPWPTAHRSPERSRSPQVLTARAPSALPDPLCAVSYLRPSDREGERVNLDREGPWLRGLADWT
jgi:hypothetical protein